ncbi:MAG TPA: AMP-binding protein [Sporichthyaceae bacterium]|nr:AMP-binding protein [Sporichthyaceae bacterium]
MGPEAILRPAARRVAGAVRLAVATAELTRSLPVDTFRAARFALAQPGPIMAAALGTARSGVVPPLRPDLTLRQLDALRRDGLGLTGAMAAAVAMDQDALALIDDEGAYSRRELTDDARRLAAALADLGIGGGDRVGIGCRNHVGFVLAVLALARLGADAVLLNTGAGPEQIARVLSAQRIRLLIADADLELPTLPPEVRMITAWPQTSVAGPTLRSLIEGVRRDRDVRRPDRSSRLIVLTSGTTGTPKGAARPEPSATAGLIAIAGLLGRVPLRADQLTAIPAPLFHAWGLGGLQLSLAGRAPVLLSRHFDAEATYAAIEACRVRQLFVVPVMLNRMLALPPEIRYAYDTSSVRLIVSSGSALHPRTVHGVEDQFGPVLHNLYGSTEASWVSIAGPKDLAAEPGTAGRPPLATRLRILDDTGACCPTGTVGRIFVGHAMLFSGYLEAPDTDGAPTEGLMATGDLGHLDADGRLFVDGREDDLVVSGGENVFCREVADVIAAVPGILDAAVVGVPDVEFGARLAAFVVIAPGSPISAEDVRTVVRTRLARHAVPREVTFLEELPRNAAGKVLAGALRASLE